MGKASNNVQEGPMSLIQSISDMGPFMGQAGAMEKYLPPTPAPMPTQPQWLGPAFNQLNQIQNPFTQADLTPEQSPMDQFLQRLLEMLSGPQSMRGRF